VGAETPLLESPADELVEDWSKDGRYLAYLSGPDQFRDIYVMPFGGDRKPVAAVQGRYHKDEPQFSYDAKWLAYTSDETGQFQVYVVSFPALDQKLQVSVNGGGQPRWKKDSRELYFRDPNAGAVMAVEIKPGPKIEAGVPFMLFRGRGPSRSATRHLLCVSPDGLRFLERGPPGLAVGLDRTGGVPQGPSSYFPTGQDPRGTGAFTIPERGLTVVRHWMAGLEKAK
jgi:hypothetical protein